ncbi:MAG: nucleoside hydrolase, partial [Planctomycetaceae bacterium]
MEQKVIIDADPGIGDALAILAALLDPQLDVLAVTATAGCVPARQATQNVQAIIELLDPPKWPRLGEADAELSRFIEDLHFATASVADLNGPAGLGNCNFSGADLHNRRESTKLMIDVVRSHPDEVTLLTLGPLTNVEVACERAPDFMDLLGRLVCLGGSISAGGDVTAAAEFNLYAHPAAARHILLSPATKTLVPLDVSHQAIFTFEHYNR